MRHLIETLTEREMVLFDAAVRIVVAQSSPGSLNTYSYHLGPGLDEAMSIVNRIIGERVIPNPGTSGINPLVNPLAGPPKGYPQ